MSLMAGNLPTTPDGRRSDSGYAPGYGVLPNQLGVPSGDTTANAGGQQSAPQVMAFLQSVANQNPADSLAAANLVSLVHLFQTGTGLFSPRRIVTKFIQLQAVAITHATPVDLYTPTTGKKFRILSYHISSTIASAIQFEDSTGVEVLRTPILAAAGIVASPEMGNGILSTAANNHLFLDATVTTNVTGWIAISEE